MLCTVQNVNKLLKVYASNKNKTKHLFSFTVGFFHARSLSLREIETADLLQPGSYFWCSLQ